MNWTPLIQQLRDALPTLLAIYGFGSRVGSDAGPESDLDMAVLVEGKVDPIVLWELAEGLAERVACTVDLLDLRAATTVMQYQVITTGERLWTRDHRAALYESFILSEKTALDEVRAPLLSRIQREGTIHDR